MPPTGNLGHRATEPTAATTVGLGTDSRPLLALPAQHLGVSASQHPLPTNSGEKCTGGPPTHLITSCPQLFHGFTASQITEPPCKPSVLQPPGTPAWDSQDPPSPQVIHVGGKKIKPPESPTFYQSPPPRVEAQQVAVAILDLTIGIM